MSDYICRILDVTEYDHWDEFVDLSPQGMVFHKSHWIGASGMDFNIYGCFKGDKLVAGLPLACRRVGVAQATHPPMTPYLGMVYKNSDTKYVSRISDEKKIATVMAKQLKNDFNIIDLRLAPSVIDLQSFIWEGFSSSVGYTYILTLDDLEDVWKRMDAKRRNDITRAEKDGIYVDVSDDFEEAFALVEKTFQRQSKGVGFKAIANRYNDILRQREQCKSFLAKNGDGKAIAAVYIVWDNKRSYYLLGGYDSDKSHHGASAIAMWAAIKFTKEQLGLNQFDFEGSMIPPVERFFRKFGGTLMPCYSISWSGTLGKLALNTWRLARRGAGIVRAK